MSKVIAVDVDGVCADLNTEWLRRYNFDYDDTLTPEDLTEWDMTASVKPECGENIYGYLHEPGLYLDVKPYLHALAGVELLRRAGHRVIFVTSCPLGTADAKGQWLVDHGFLPNQPHQPDFFPVNDKGMIRADVLIDDRVKNLTDFTDNGRRPFTEGVLVYHAHNRNCVWYGEVARDLLEAAQLIIAEAGVAK